MKKIFTLLLSVAALNAFAQPSNDNRANAIELTNLNNWGSTDAAYTTVGATFDGPSTCGHSANNVWFKFQATSNEIDIKVLSGEGKGTIGGVFLTLHDASGNTILCHLGGWSMTAVIQMLSLTAGSWYYISVESTDPQAGTFTLSVTDEVNYDLREKAALLTDISSWVSGDAAYSTIGATADGLPGTCGRYSNNVWLKFQATTNEIDIKVLSGGNKGTIGGLYLTLQDASGNTVLCQQSYGMGYLQSISITPGAWYYIIVDTPNNQAGTFTLSVSDVVNYDFRAKAELLTDISSWVSPDAAYNTIGSTFDGVASTCGHFYNNVWFKFQATTNEIDIKVLSGGSKGTIGSIYLTLQDISGNTVLCNTGGWGSPAVIQTLSLTPGAWYFISVDSQETPVPTFTLSVNDVVNYDFRGKAEVLMDLSSWTSADAAYSTAGATFDGPASSCGHFSNNVWFKFQAISTDIDIRALSGGNKGTIGAVYLTLQDATGNTLQCHASGFGNPAYVQTSALVPGSWYYISVDTQDYPSSTFTLSINDDLNNDTKSAAEEISHEAQWCSPDKIYDNIAALTDILNNGDCTIPFAENVWFKFKATSSNVTLKLQSGGDKGTLSNPAIHLINETSTLKCTQASGLQEAMLEYNALQKGSWYYISVGTNGGNAGTFTLCIEGGAAPSQLCQSIYCDAEGNVSIGTPLSATGYKLSVQGKIMAEGVKVELQSRWPDYVFNETFDLQTLPELKRYIETNGHLPDVPAAAVVEKEGIDLGAMNAVLLKKIEEITLYLIRQNEEMEKLKKEVERLKK